MTKWVNAGELRTGIMIFDLPRDGHDEVELRSDGHPASEPVSMFGKEKTRHCKWVDAWSPRIYTTR